MVDRTLTMPRTVSGRSGWAVPVAAGVFVGAVVFDALPGAISLVEGQAALWVVAGLGLMLGLNRLGGNKSMRWAAWSASLGVWLHSVLEGLAAGAATALGWGGAALLTLGLMVHLIPESVALYTVLTESGMGVRRALIRCAATWGLVGAGFAASELLMAEAPAKPLGALLGLAAGMFLFLAYSIWQHRTNRAATGWLAALMGAAWIGLLHL